MASFNAAIIKANGVDFAVVAVEPWVLDDADQSRDLIARFSVGLSRPVVLVDPAVTGAPVYVGRPELVQFLGDTRVAALPWEEFTVV